MTDYDTITRVNELYRQERNKAAVDRVCKGFAIVAVLGFWVLIVGLCLLEAGR